MPATKENLHSIAAEIGTESKNFQFPDFSSLFLLMEIIPLFPFSRLFYDVLVFLRSLLVWIGIRIFVIKRRRGRKRKTRSHFCKETEKGAQAQFFLLCRSPLMKRNFASKLQVTTRCQQPLCCCNFISQKMLALRCNMIRRISTTLGIWNLCSNSSSVSNLLSSLRQVLC